jgi:phosphatidylglycerophosphate synthase
MNLHRIKGKPDWERTAESKLNYWQQLAEQTHGVVTPANAATIAGLVVVIVGLFEVAEKAYLAGLIILFIGRCFDILDGMLAQTTHTKSPLGERLDATVDKISTGLTFIAFYFCHIVSWWVIVLLLIPQAKTAILTFIALKDNFHLHPSLRGKLSMASMWLTLVGFLSLKVFTTCGHTTLRFLSYLLVVLSVALGLAAVVGYLLEIIRNRRSRVAAKS